MPDTWDTRDAQTHRVGDGCQPPHAEPRQATAPYPPEIADVLADLAEGRPVDALRMRNFQAELDYLIQSRPRHTEEHLYISTACAHGRPEDCRQSCKYCGATCTSGYEHTGEDPGSIVDKLAAVQAVRNDLASVARWCTTHGINPTAGVGVFLGTVRSQLTAALDGTL